MHAQEMQRQMEELELGQDVLGKKLSMYDNCFYACAGDAASDGGTGAGTARAGEEAVHV
jgi:hypothetical protein